MHGCANMALKELSDNNLISECGKDNLKAFDILFERYSSKLYRYALRYINDEHLAEEAMMDLMLWVWEKRHSINIEGEFQSYIFRAMKNATIKTIRKKPLVNEPIELFENDGMFKAQAADHQLIEREVELKYLEKLDMLSPQRKRVFQLSREEKLTHAEIASNMNISVFTVKNHIKASLSHFREHLKDLAEITTALILISWFKL